MQAHCAWKWDQGRKTHGPEWVGADPIEEFLDELADAHNYLQEAQRRGHRVPSLMFLALHVLYYFAGRIRRAEPERTKWRKL